MRHGFLWFAAVYVVLALPLALAIAAAWRCSEARWARITVATVAIAAFWAFSIYAIMLLPRAIFSRYESGRWPSAPLGSRQRALSLSSGDVIRLDGREIRHWSIAARDWWWDLSHRSAEGPVISIGGAWSHADSLAVDVLESDGLLALILTDQPIVFARAGTGRFRSYSFAYPFLDNATFRRSLMWSMALDSASIERMWRDLTANERESAPSATVESLDLRARQVVVRYRWPTSDRLAVFDGLGGDLRLTVLRAGQAPP